MFRLFTSLTLIAALALVGCHGEAPAPAADAGGDSAAADAGGADAGDAGDAGDDAGDAGDAGDAKDPEQMAIPVRVYRFTYTANIPKPADGTKLLRIWAPLPRTETGVQEVKDLKIVSPAGAKMTTAADYGNKFMYVEVANPTAGVKVEWTAIITRYEDHGQGKGDQNPRYLKGVKLIDIDGSASGMASKIVEKLKLSEAANDTERARLIYNDVLDEMVYDKKEPGYGMGDFVRSIEVCKGNCTDFHARFMGVGRKAGIPVRFTMGIPLKPGGTYNSYHCWAHWYDKASDTWKPVDISEADKVADKDPAKAKWYFGHLGKNRITLTYGRDLMLEPKQAGPPMNYMVFPYAEADGKGVKMGKKDWVWTYKDVESK